jgi:molybdopterin/thiamine biosynthesis adenylyltransferase
MTPVLKRCSWERDGGLLRIIRHTTTAIQIVDEDGRVEALLRELAGVPSSLEHLRARLSAQGIEVTQEDLGLAVRTLNDIGLVENGAERRTGDPSVDARFASNLAFFELLSSLGLSRSDLQRRVNQASVLVLGAGGLGCVVLQCLAGLGVERITIVDHDEVAIGNLTRQFLYRHGDVGIAKVDRAQEWLREFDPAIQPRAVRRAIARAADLDDLLGGVTVVVAALDQPADVALHVNEACVRAGIPFVAGGIRDSLVRYYSISVTHGPCLACLNASVPRGSGNPPRENQAIAPMITVLGGLVAMETLRYIGRFEAPRSAGAFTFVDFLGANTPVHEPWPVDPGCAVCSTVRH